MAVASYNHSRYSNQSLYFYYYTSAVKAHYKYISILVIQVL